MVARITKAKLAKTDMADKECNKVTKKFKGGVPKEQRRVKGAPGERIMAKRSERGTGLKFKTETYQAVLAFRPGTKIKYVPNPKTAGSKSFVRYARYEKAQTVGESLKCGSKLADLLWELERGYYRVLGGVRSESAERAALGANWYEKADKMLKCFKGPRGLNVNLDNPKAAAAVAKVEAWREQKLKRVEHLAKTLKIKIENEDEISALGIHEAQELHAERKVCDYMCQKKLQESEKSGKPLEVKDLQEIMQLWGFAQNVGRLNVMREGVKYVYSDTLGAIKQRCAGYGITSATKHYPNFMRFLCQWLKDNHLEKQLGCDFKFTAINLNANYAGARHRDGNNEGPSVIRAVGDFTGGKLKYWPTDTQKNPRPALSDLNLKESVAFDLKKNTVIFDGCRAHEVEDFEGERYSIVFFTASGYGKVPADKVKYLQGLGMPWPCAKSMDVLKKATKAHIEGKKSSTPTAVRKMNVRKMNLKKRS